MTVSFEQAAREIVEAGRWLDSRGWAPAGAGNYSMRLDDGAFGVTVSGTHKGRIGPADVMRVDAEGQSMDGRRPSAEVLLHMQIYRLRPAANAVLHTHSAKGTVLTRRLAGDALRLSGYEVMKAFPGVDGHDGTVALPVVDNDQDMVRLAGVVQARLEPATPAYLIRGHGLYGWGASMDEASRVVEAAEFLLECELETLKLTGGGG
jgi:methylthioribulose-1-phosphate dehydratase